MNQPVAEFKKQTEIFALFSSEKAIRENPVAFRNHCYGILEERDLPLSKIALDFYLELLNRKENKSLRLRKDGGTPREQHEESHIVTADTLLKVVGEGMIQPEKFGSVDAFFSAIILHDVIEDLKQSGDDIRKALEDGVTNLSIDDKRPILHDIDQVIIMVELLSRKDQDVVRFGNDRIQQAKKWQEHPYCHVIKLIDWCNKLQTMVDVEHFEKNDRQKMEKVLNETSLIFGDEQQDMTGRAIEKFPFIEPACKPMAGIMGVLYHSLNAYVKLRAGELEFDPQEAYPFNFKKYMGQSCDLLAALPIGNNYIGPALDRLENVGRTEPKVASFIQFMVQPSLGYPAPNQTPANSNQPVAIL